jgi:3',5'-cyclic-AMP phosphodiesterase
MLIAQLSDLHVGGARHDDSLLRTAIAEVNEAEPDIVVIAGDLTGDGYPDQFELAGERLAAIACPRVVVVPGNHDARHVGHVHFERTFGARDSRLALSAGATQLALVAVDTSRPDVDEGEIGRERYAWIDEGFAGAADLRIFVCHHHLMPIPGTGRERNQLLDAGDVLASLRRAGVDLVLAGHRHVPYVWPVAGMLLVHSGTVSTRRTRGFAAPAYNLVRVEQDVVSVELRVPGRQRQSLGEYPRAWPPELSSRAVEPFAAGDGASSGLSRRALRGL